MAAATRGIARDVPEVPGGRRVLGHAMEFRRDPLALFAQARAHGDVVRIRFGPFPVYLLNSPEVISQALVSQARKLEKGISFGRVGQLIGNGLVLSSGEYHHRQRRLMQPAFHRSQIPGYMDTMRDVAVPRIEAWPDGGTLALDLEMRSITLTVLTRTLLSSGIDREAIEEIERLLRVLLAELLPGGIIANIPALAWVPKRSNRRFAVASRRLGAMLTGIIDGYRAAGADHGDLMSILMRASDDETGTGMTGKQLRDEATTLVIAGSETTGNTLAWACYLLAQHPEIQERLHQEAALALPGGDAGHEALDRLPFTRAVVTETLRLYSPVWVLPRQAAADVDLGGYQLPAGSRMLFSPYALNRDARLHRDPGRFDPDRWAAGYSRTQMRASFFPFGQGIRNCIGEGFAWAESMLLLSAIAARWKLKLAAALAPPEPKLQHTALRLTARGWETLPLLAPDGSGVLSVALDLRTHQVVAEHSDGRTEHVALTPNRPVRDVTRDVLAAVRELAGPVQINPRPQEVPWSTPLDQDEEHATYDPAHVSAYFAAATRAALVLSALRAPYRGRCSPVNAWRGSFDLAVSLFSGRPAEPASGDFIMRNAGDAQQIEVGWLPGDGRYPRAAFFAYAYPAPAGYAAATLSPAAARWDTGLGEFVLDWDDARASADPHRAALEFGRSSVRHACAVCGWDTALAASVQGVPPPIA